MPKLLGITYGDPYSAGTYSGVPFHLFAELESRRAMVGRLNADQHRYSDFFRGFVDVRRSWKARRPRRNAYWRFLPENIALLTRRMQPVLARAPVHDTTLQIGVAGIPKSKNFFAAHVEISVETAAALPVFAESYGFNRGDDALLERAIEGEAQFMQACDLIWTNTRWTAQTFAERGIPAEKFWIHPPACNVADPGDILRRWESPHVLFVGKDWERKGGPLLLQAFALLRRHYPNAQLTIIGCSPAVTQPGVRVLGYLDKARPSDAALIHQANIDATVFCMPSSWESVGLVYMEAALYGLPLIMLEGQGRREIFPTDMAFHLQDPTPEVLGDTLLHLSQNPELAAAMGHAGRQHVQANYSWPMVAQRLLAEIERRRLRVDGFQTKDPQAVSQTRCTTP